MKKAILILAANPQGDIRIDREIRDLQKAIERNKNSEQFEVKIALAVRPEDLQELLYENKPYIVHFCGHGAGEQGLVFESNTEGKQLVSNQALSGLFKIFKDNVECVLLNACHTEAQADVIVEHVEYVIGTSREILDKAAYFFAVGFYKALVREKSIETCYEWGCNTVQLSMPKVNIVPHSSERFRKMEVIEEDGSKVVSEPLKIVLKQQSNLEKQLVKTNFSQSVGNSNLSPDIPPDFRQEIAKEGNIKQYKNTTRKTIKELGQSPLIKRETISRNEYRQRKTLLNKVKEFWIEGFLKHSLYANTAINLDLKSRPDEVLRPFEGLEEITVELDDSFEELQPTDILRQTGQGKTLLILGDPGSGKTITLLQLAQKLVNQTEQDLTKPIPVVFNLSSWGQKQQPIEKWLIEEFKDKYQVPLTWSEPWIKQEQLILLLDGLDEVRGEQRNACVKALNQFIATHNVTEMVVCSRVKDYEALTERLRLSSAIYIKPLSPEQVYSFLAKAGDSLAGLKTLLQQDPELEQFAQTPLILNIMSRAYQGWSAKKLLQQFRTTQDRYRHLFDSYIERMLHRRGIGKLEQNPNLPQYPQEKVLHWLSWLAKTMVNESKIIFLIEKMQPNLLESRSEARIYRMRNFPLAGLIFGAILGLILGLIFIFFERESYKEFLSLGVIFGAIFGVIVGVNAGLLSKEITLFEQMSWSWQRAKSTIILEVYRGLSGGLMVGLSLGLSLELINIIYLDAEGIDWVLVGILGLISAGILGLSSALSSGLGSGEVKQRTVPNQGIRSSLKNSVILGLIFWLIVVLLGVLIFGLILNHTIDGFDTYDLEQALFVGIFVGIFVGLFVGLRYGGATWIKHFNLRRILYRQGRIPWNYARFLDYASERLLMKKVGGGYVFYHRMLMEHFAQRNQVS